MNIFYVSSNPDICAQALDDKRLNKMQVETAQLLCTAAHLRGAPAVEIPYKPAYLAHPCTLWTAHSNNNYNWLLCYLRALNSEWWFRGFNAHATASIDFNRFVCYIPTDYLTPPPKLVVDKSRGIDCSAIEPITSAYQQYLNCKWNMDKHAPKWTVRGAPGFYIPSRG